MTIIHQQLLRLRGKQKQAIFSLTKDCRNKEVQETSNQDTQGTMFKKIPQLRESATSYTASWELRETIIHHVSTKALLQKLPQGLQIPAKSEQSKKSTQ